MVDSGTNLDTSVVELCEAQLAQLELDALVRFEALASVGVAFMDSIAAHDAGTDVKADEVAADFIEDMTVQMQFMDEFAQRLQHVREVLGKWRAAAREGGGDVEEMADVLSRTFSLHAERDALGAAAAYLVADDLGASTLDKASTASSGAELF